MPDTPTPPARPKGKASVLKQFFGFKQGEGLKEFAAEVKQLTDQDYVDLVTGIENGSLTY